MSIFNRVTEKPRIGKAMWLVSAEWRGGHDRRLFRLDNLHHSEVEAKADWDRLTLENHNKGLGNAEDFDAGFVRHPIRKFIEEAK